jgi:hydrophobe/amphiphile efflux-3 (HAE3) family protein
MERVYQFIVNRPKTLILVVFLVTCFFAYHARSIRIDSSIESLLPKNDIEKDYYYEIRKVFGSDEIGVIGLITDNIYTQEVLEKISRITDEIAKIPGVEKAISITNAIDPVTDILEPPLIMPKIPSLQKDFDALRQKLAGMPIYLKNIVSEDGRAAAINIFFANMDDDEFLRLGIDDTIQAVVERENGPEKLYYTGLPHFKVHSAKSMKKDLMYFVPLVLSCMLMVLFISFRSVLGTLLPVFTVLIGLIWTLGIMVLTGASISLGCIALPPLILALGATYSLHVISEYYEQALPGRTVQDVVLETLRNIAAPVFITAMTTVLGFFSLSVNRIRGIQDMGIYASVGITIAFIMSVVFVPAVLAGIRLPKQVHDDFSPKLAAFLRKVGDFDIRHHVLIIIIGAIIVILSVWQMFSIEVDSNFHSFFRKNDPIRQATDAINNDLVGSMAFYVVIDGEQENIIKQYDSLKRIRKLQNYIDSLSGVDKTISFVDYCELVDRSIQEDILLNEENNDGEAKPSEIKTFWENPPQLEGVGEIVFLSPKNFSRVVNLNLSRSNILVRTTLSRSKDIKATVKKINAFAKETFPPEFKVHATGKLVLLTRTTSDIVIGQIKSLSIAAGVIFIIMWAMFLSRRVGVIAMIPNVFPIVVFFGLMGATGTYLNLGTSVIAAIALGIAVDDTVHLMVRLSSAIKSLPNQTEALLQSITTVGKPVVYSTILLCLGFGTLYFSSFVPIQEFGFLAAITVMVALFADLLRLPAFLTTTRIVTLWDMMYVKLGKDPHKTIPLFDGLRPSQAKIIVLMGELKSYSKGEAMICQGDMGNDMFVIINGKGEVLHSSEGKTWPIRELLRGDVFGEMGLIRHQKRTADVIATEDTSVMVINEKFLSRLQKRYPRIGSKIFLNLSIILSTRLHDLTQRAADR